MNIVLKSMAAWAVFSSPLLCAEEKTYDIDVEIKMQCPAMDELHEFTALLPDPQASEVDYATWKANFITSMTKLIQLVETDKVKSSSWSAHVQSTEKANNVGLSVDD